MLAEEVATEQLVARICLEELRRLEDRERIYTYISPNYAYSYYTSEDKTLEIVEFIFAHLRNPRQGVVFFVVGVHRNPVTNDFVADEMYAELRSLVWNAGKTALEDLQDCGNLEMIIQRVYQEEQGMTRFRIWLTRGPLAVPTPTHIHVSMRTS